MLKKCLFTLTAIFLLCGASKDLYLKDITVSELKEIYKNNEYKDYIYMPNWKYPRIFLENLPKDIKEVPTAVERNKIFLMIMGPLALRLEAEIIQERKEIEEINNAFAKKNELSPKQIKTIEEKTQKYDIFSNLKGLRRYQLLLQELMLKVDSVPPSILIASAAINTNWGTSKPALEANNLYKDIEWYTQEGLKPVGTNEDFRFKIYPSLYDSMRAYALKVNSNSAYSAFRNERKEYRYRERPVLGRHMASAFVLDNNLENFAGLLDYTITFYELTNFDEASLK